MAKFGNRCPNFARRPSSHRQDLQGQSIHPIQHREIRFGWSVRPSDGSCCSPVGPSVVESEDGQRELRRQGQEEGDCRPVPSRPHPPAARAHASITRVAGSAIIVECLRVAPAAHRPGTQRGGGPRSGAARCLRARAGGVVRGPAARCCALGGMGGACCDVAVRRARPADVRASWHRRAGGLLHRRAAREQLAGQQALASRLRAGSSRAVSVYPAVVLGRGLCWVCGTLSAGSSARC